MRLFQAKEVARLQQECEMLRSRPETDERLSEYYETKIRDMFEEQQEIRAKAESLLAENKALCERLESMSIEKAEVEEDLERGVEEFRFSSVSYKNQIDALTEHLAAQNEKITQLSDEIEELQMQLAVKK